MSDKKVFGGRGMGAAPGHDEAPHRKLVYMPTTRVARLHLSSRLQEIELVEDKGASFWTSQCLLQIQEIGNKEDIALSALGAFL